METLRPPKDFKDPRNQEDFSPDCWPSCNGKDAPTFDPMEIHVARCIEFLASYYTLNRLNQRLLSQRAAEDTEDSIAETLAALRDAQSRHLWLEDHYAPIGFYGEPTMDGLLYTDIRFTKPGLPKQPTILQSHLAIPGLENIPPEELRGPVTQTRDL